MGYGGLKPPIKRLSTVSSARNWWLRGCNPSNSNNVRNVNTDGTLNNNNANNANGLVVDCVRNGELKVTIAISEISAYNAGSA